MAQRRIYHKLVSFSVGYLKIVSVYDTRECQLLGCVVNDKWKVLRRKMFYINNCPTRCNTKQSIYSSASSLYMFRVPTTPITRSTQNCNYILRFWSYVLCSYLSLAWPRWREVADQYRRLQLQFCVLLMMGVVDTRNT